jgi:hypothetical protein
VTILCTALCTTKRKTPLLDAITRCRKRGFDSFCQVARVVLDKLPEPGCNVCLCDVDIVASSHGGRAVAY